MGIHISVCGWGELSAQDRPRPLPAALRASGTCESSWIGLCACHLPAPGSAEVPGDENLPQDLGGAEPPRPPPHSPQPWKPRECVQGGRGLRNWVPIAPDVPGAGGLASGQPHPTPFLSCRIRWLVVAGHTQGVCGGLQAQDPQVRKPSSLTPEPFPAPSWGETPLPADRRHLAQQLGVQRGEQ